MFETREKRIDEYIKKMIVKIVDLLDDKV